MASESAISLAAKIQPRYHKHITRALANLTDHSHHTLTRNVTSARTSSPPQRLARFFHKLDGNYQIIKSVRGLVIFGLHDLGLSAPFPHMDLVLCRNVLMYFTRELQSRALQAFAFSLRNGGYLALGAAESTSPAAEYFTPVSPTLKLYRRIGNRVQFPMPVPMPIPETLKPLAPGMARRRVRVPSNAGEGASAVPVGETATNGTGAGAARGA